MARRHILVVEDDCALATLFESALSDAGFAVDVTGDGLTAIDDIDEGHPDLVVLDLQLPQVDGTTILREVAAAPGTRDIPVIVVTGSDADTVPADAILLRKPCDPQQLVALVEQELRRAAA